MTDNNRYLKNGAENFIPLTASINPLRPILVINSRCFHN